MDNKIKIRAFRAVDEPEASEKFAVGHSNVLSAYGVTKVTSASNEWMDNPDVYVCMAETPEGEAMGGVRVHVANGTIHLPMEIAISKVEENVHDFMKKHAANGAAELCGLWNSRDVAGFGIGTTYLMWAGIAITNQLKVNSLFALCAEHTLKISVEKGFVIEMGLGNRGTFFYPKIDLIATSIIIRDPDKLTIADAIHRDKIFSLRENPNQTMVEDTSRGPLELEFDLKLKNINPLPFHAKEDTNSLWFLSLLFTSFFVAAQNSNDVFQITEEPVIIGNYLYLLEDKEGALTIDEVIKSGEFEKIGESVPNLGTSNSSFWIKFTINNESNIQAPVLNLEAPVLDELSFFYPNEKGEYVEIKSGEQLDFGERKYKEESFIFDLKNSASPVTYYIRIHSGEQMLLPISVGKKKLVLESQNNKRVLFGIYAGIILVMFFYNLFVWISTKDKSYLWYILHTLFVGLTQASLQGYAYQYLWPNSTWMANNSIFIFTCLVSLAGIEFLKVFLHTKQNAPRLHKGLHVFSGIYFVFIIMSLIGIHSTTYGLILGTQSLVALYILGTGLYIYKKGFQPAKFYLLAWGLLMVGIIIYVMKDFGVLPYNLFTSSSLLIGSALEVALLSFALANKINLLRQENEENQRKVVDALKENERIVLEQNIMLEQKVTERTSELNDALTTLKNAQAKLVDSEKMSSLGQLTAGIAHEINNPVNFITSNIKPLDRDIKDMMELIGKYEEIKDAEGLEDKLQAIESFKKEVDYDFLKEEVELLVKTIDDGAQRTSEIVKGLRNFSRVDEQDLKRGDIHVGIDSTLMLLRNKLDNINVIKNYGELPEIDCYMGKLNQVFMNIIGNAIHAMKENRKVNPKGELVITTTEVGANIQINIKDNGTGMDEETKNKVFEPFFTTKGVGQGTGLGLSIVFSIIYESHNGKIEVESVKGEGSEFIITLPKVQEN